jgi:TonB-linked SusC/RagA family outer membrane protein
MTTNNGSVSLQKKNLMRNFTSLWRATLCLLLLFSTIAGSSFAASEGEGPAESSLAWRITGTVTSETGEALPGVSVIVKGTTPPIGVSTDMNGNYTLNVPETSGTLVFSFIGYETLEKAFSGPAEINVSLREDIKSLQEVVVTGYTTQNREDITGAVSIVSSEELLQTPSANVSQQLQGRVAGITATGTGAPGQGAKIRVRGFGSLGNNDPLYVIDGVPTQDANNLNPNDVESMTVLKDASAASIYGSRAANGVIIITTKKGKTGAPKITLDSYYGTQIAPDGPEMLNTQQYGEYLWQAARNAGATPSHQQYGNGESPRIPDFIRAGDLSGVMADNPATNPDLYDIRNGYQITPANKEGTDWWDAVFDPAPIQSHNLGVNGATESANYNVSFNYFNQDGIAKYTNYERYTVRANTSFTLRDNFRIGENMFVSYSQSNLGNLNSTESVISDIYRMQPIVPVYDIMGNFAGTAGEGLGNGRNPVADLYRTQNNSFNRVGLLGNIFAELDLLNNFTARTSFGIDYNTRYTKAFQPVTYERSENIGTNSLNERNDFNRNWTWTNTLMYQNKFADMHDLTVIVGTEAIQNHAQGLGGRRLDFFSEDPNFLILDTGSPTGQTNFSYLVTSSLFSVFGKADYTLASKYLFNATLRRDGYSGFGNDVRFGTFPAFSLGWRLSEEGFMQGVTFVENLKVRGGWGKMGNQTNVPAANAYTYYRTDPARSSYDIGGTNNSIVTGYDTGRFGNLSTKWEASVTTNVGIDGTLFNNKLDFAIDLYRKDSEGLLIPAQAPATLGGADMPFVNIGDMRNQGIDLMLGHRGTVAGALRYDLNLTVSRYVNEVLKVGENEEDFFMAGGTRFGNVTRNIQGQPVSSFWGYQIDGIFQTEAEVDAGPDMPYKRVGSWRIKDIDGDGQITSDDQTFIGNPHPDFTAGLNIGLGYKNFDFNMFLYSVVGNEIYNYMKYWTDFNTFSGGRSTRILTDTWRPDNTDATLPILNATDSYSNAISTDYYVEDGSYLRARTVQLGYTLGEGTRNRFGLGNVRIYVQAQNLFTITGYTGIDPDLSIQNVGNAANGSRDQAIGIDWGFYPTPKQYLVGINIGI